MATGARAAEKQRTRERIAARAMELFARRGFDDVPVTEVAEAAGVTERTVFNHFATKEDLVYSDDAVFEAALLQVVRDRAPGESVLDAVSGFLLERYTTMPTNPQVRKRQFVLAQLITNSAALRARERAILDRYAARLADVIADELRSDVDDLRPRVAADTLLSVHRAAIDTYRRHAIEGLPPDRYGPGVVAAAERSFHLLSAGLDDLGRRTRPVSAATHAP